MNVLPSRRGKRLLSLQALVLGFPHILFSHATCSWSWGLLSSLDGAHSSLPRPLAQPGKEIKCWCDWGSRVNIAIFILFQFSSVLSLSCVRLFVTPWTVVRQASLCINNSRSLPKLMFIESVMPSNHLILCRLLLLPSIFPSIRVFSSESVLHIRWPKYWSFSFNINYFIYLMIALMSVATFSKA